MLKATGFVACMLAAGFCFTHDAGFIGGAASAVAWLLLTTKGGK